VRVLIVGCGYVGLALGEILVRQGHEVFGLRRRADNEDLKRAGLIPLVGDLTRPEDLTRLPGPFEWVVNAAASNAGGEEAYRQTYLEGTRSLLRWLSGQPLKKFVYTSSTSVYGQTDGSLVKESSPTEPASGTGRILVETEQLLLEAHRAVSFPAVILRVAGIYGPGRGYWFQKFLRHEVKIASRGERVLNMIHRDDVAGAILAALENGKAGEVYNVADDEPVTHLAFFRWLSETLGQWMPPFAAPEEAEPAPGKRGFTQKKVSNRKLRMELGYQLKYPTFRQGYTAEIIRLDSRLG
jgi:nucleoside-diphosphate-sugar epimerase